MKIFNIIIFSLFISGWMSAQTTMTSAKDNDPKAKVLLDKLKKEFDSYKTMEVTFEMELEVPGRQTEKFKGQIIQDGKKYLVKMKDQEIYADGQSVWVYLKPQKEVQISDFEDGDDSGFLSPKQLMTLYDRGDFVYFILEERKVGNQLFADIEFKPLNKRSDFSKIRLTIDKKLNKMVALRVFFKDGTKSLFTPNNIISNKTYPASTFVLNTKGLTGVNIEDLRLN